MRDFEHYWEEVTKDIDTETWHGVPPEKIKALCKAMYELGQLEERVVQYERGTP